MKCWRGLDSDKIHQSWKAISDSESASHRTVTFHIERTHRITSWSRCSTSFPKFQTQGTPMYNFTEKKLIFPKSIKSNKWCQTRCKVNKTFIMNDFYFHSDAFLPISEITFSRVFFTFAYFLFKLECQNLDLSSNKKLVLIYIHIQIYNFFRDTL